MDGKTALAQVVTGAQALSDMVDTLASQMASVTAERDSLSAANVELQAQLDTANATIAKLQAQNDPWALVDKTGATDVTDKVQALISKGLAVPAGKYLIDPSKPLLVNVPGSKLTMDPNAVLIAKPNSLPRYYVLKVTADDCVVTGGQIVGDRYQHNYVDTGDKTRTHEWGLGLSVSGNRCTVTGLKVSNCPGDGIGVTGDDCTIGPAVISTGNRRNNLSAYDCNGLVIKDSEFSNAGNGGNPDPAGLIGPFAGIDVEPDRLAATSVTLTNNKILNNAHAGLCAWLRKEVGGSITITASGNTITGNANGIHAKALAGKISITVNGNTLTNKSCNCRVESGAAFDIAGNTFALVGKTRTPQTITGLSTVYKYDIQFPTTTGLPNGTAKVGTNSYV
jgi:hypothetical protein